MQIVVLSVDLAASSHEFTQYCYGLHDYKNTALMHSAQIPVSRVKVTYTYVKLLPITVTTEELES